MCFISGKKNNKKKNLHLSETLQKIYFFKSMLQFVRSNNKNMTKNIYKQKLKQKLLHRVIYGLSCLVKWGNKLFFNLWGRWIWSSFSYFWLPRMKNISDFHSLLSFQTEFFLDIYYQPENY